MVFLVAAGLHRQERQDQRRQLPTTDPPRRIGAVGNSALRPRSFYTSTGLSAGIFGQINNRPLWRAVSWLLEQRCLAAELAKSQPDGLLRVV